MKGLDLFAGCGGASLGMMRAGVDVVAHYERDPDACATLRMVTTGVHEVDLATLDPGALPQVGMWWASPPCQPFSAAGKRAGQWDTRDGYPHVLRLLEHGPRPTWLVLENVRGLLFPRHAAYWFRVVRALRQWFGWVEWQVLDAADYGVPQHRRRVLTVCGPRPVVWPEPTHGPGRAHPWVTMGEALSLAEPVGEPWITDDGRPSWRWRASETTEPCRTIGTKANAFLRRPSLTVTATEDKVTSGSSLHSHSQHRRAGDLVRRRLTIEECAILQDLAGHPIQGRTKASRYRQVGNAVPPRLAQVVVQSVLDRNA